MRQMSELGRVDITVEVSHLSSFLAMKCKGNMVSALHIIYYLRIKQNYFLVLDPSYANINLSEFLSEKNWNAFYGDSKEAKTHSDPNPLGKEIEIIMFVD